MLGNIDLILMLRGESLVQEWVYSGGLKILEKFMHSGIATGELGLSCWQSYWGRLHSQLLDCSCSCRTKILQKHACWGTRSQDR